MKKLFIIACLEMSVFGCSPIHKCNSTDKGINTNNFGQIYQQQVGEFPVIPTNILENLDKMGIDNSLILNDYEIEYLRFIFKIDADNFNLVGKKVGFLRSKKDYFEQTRERFIQSAVGYQFGQFFHSQPAARHQTANNGFMAHANSPFFTGNRDVFAAAQ